MCTFLVFLSFILLSAVQATDVNEPILKHVVDPKKGDDPHAAERWFKENGIKTLHSQEKQNNPYAQYILGLHYAQGECVVKDVVRARTLLEKAIAQGCQEARVSLRHLRFTIDLLYSDGE